MEQRRSELDNRMELSFPKLLTILYKHLAVIVIFTILGGAAAFSLSSFVVKPTYQSSVKMCVQPGEGDLPVNTQLNYAQEIVKTYIEILKANSFYEQIRTESGLDYSTGQLKEMVSFSILNDTEVFQITVTSNSAQDAKLLADAAAKVTPIQITKAKSASTVSLIDPAVLPETPSSPNIAFNTFLGAVAGLLISAFVCILREVFDTRVHSQEELLKAYNLPILGVVPDFVVNSKK